MELNQDWRRLQATFFPSSFPTRGLSGVGSGSIYCLHERGTIALLFSEGEDLSQWTGATLAEVRAQFPNRVLFELDRSAFDASLVSSLGETHFDSQITQWRQNLRQHGVVTSDGRTSAVEKSRKEDDLFERHLVGKRHFLLDALKDSWWTRVLPSSFGVLLRFEGSGRDYLLVYRKGKLEQFGAPDLSFLGADRRKDPGEVVKYLADRCMVPIQGVLLRDEDWTQWSDQASPWREIAWAVQSNRVQMVPFRWGVVSMMAARGLLGF